MESQVGWAQGWAILLLNSWFPGTTSRLRCSHDIKWTSQLVAGQMLSNANCVWEALIANVNIRILYSIFTFRSLFCKTHVWLWLCRLMNCLSSKEIVVRRWWGSEARKYAIENYIHGSVEIGITLGNSACYGSNLNLISSLDAKISGCRHFARKITHQACQTFPELGCQLSFVCFLSVTRGRSHPTKSIMISICNKSNVITETLSILILRWKFDPWYQFFEFIFPVHLFIYSSM